MSTTIDNIDTTTREALFVYLQRLADDQLILGHRLSEWCGHGPMLEEDIALANMALDSVGQATALLELAARIENKGRSADDLAFFREAIDYKNVQLVEQPRGDFANTIARQFIFNTYSYLLYDALCQSDFTPLADIAKKAIKEATYHLRHSRQWVLRLGDGTSESQERLQDAFDTLWMYTGELFASNTIDETLLAAGIAPNLTDIQSKWSSLIKETLAEATLAHPDDKQYMVSGSRQGRHSEHLGYLLSEMQILQRSYPGCEW